MTAALRWRVLVEKAFGSNGGGGGRGSMVGNEFTVGRAPDNDICLPSGNVSKHHARFSLRGGQLFVTDLQSTNGTYVDGARIDGSHPVNEGDRVYIGDYVLRIDLPNRPEGERPPGSVVPFPRQ
jgi:pilus assembly protein CpaF